MAEKNELTLGYASTRGDTILTASTHELQKLAVQYADDPKAFSIRIGLCRQEQIQDPNCESAILKQRLVTNDPEAWDSLGQDYSKAGRDDEALAAFSKAAQLDPSGGRTFVRSRPNFPNATAPSRQLNGQNPGPLGVRTQGVRRSPSNPPSTCRLPVLRSALG